MNDINPALARLFGLFPALALLMQCKGGFVGFTWLRPVKLRKEFATCRFQVFKRVTCIGRVGLNHESRQAVQAARESGELPPENTGLPWGEWLLFPWFITHKGGLYVRLYPVSGSAPHVVYLQDGKPISKQEAMRLCLASEFGEVNPEIGCMTLKAESLVSVRYAEKQADVVSPVSVS